jgi:hypothetical protein
MTNEHTARELEARGFRIRYRALSAPVEVNGMDIGVVGAPLYAADVLDSFGTIVATATAECERDAGTAAATAALRGGAA